MNLLNIASLETRLKTWAFYDTFSDFSVTSYISASWAFSISAVGLERHLNGSWLALGHNFWMSHKHLL